MKSRQDFEADAGVSNSITHFASRTLPLKYSNFQQIYKKKLSQFYKKKLRSDQMDPKSALGVPKPISGTGGSLLQN